MRLHKFPLISIITVLALMVFTGFAAAQERYDLGVREINTKSEWQGCGPAAAANLLGYWADQGFEIFKGISHTDTSNVTSAQVGLLLSDLAYEFGTDAESGGSWGNTIAPGIKRTLKGRKVVGCYLAEFDFLWNIGPINDYKRIVSEINSGRPVYLAGSLNPRSVFCVHAGCVTGYDYDEGLFGAYKLLVHDGYNDGTSTNANPVEELWRVIPVIPTPFTPNAGTMITLNMLEADDVNCPCGVWEVTYKFSGENEKEWPAYFRVYGDNTFDAQDLTGTFTGTWKLTQLTTWEDTAQVQFTIMYEEKPAGTYTAGFDPAGHGFEDGTMNITLTGLSGTWSAARAAGDAWQEMPELTNPYDRVESRACLLGAGRAAQ